MSGAYDYSPMVVFTAATSDVITGISTLPIGCIIQVYTTGILPAPLAIDTNYYVLASAKLSLTLNGSIVDVTTTGSGTHTYSTYGSIPLVGIERFPKDLIKAGRAEIGVSSYKAPPPANKLAAGFVYDGVTGTLAAGGGKPAQIGGSGRIY